MRRFLSILLVVLLLFSLLAVPASAMSAGAVVTAVDGLAAVSSIIAGSGVTIAALEQFDSWNNLVTAASSYLTVSNFIDAAGKILALKNGQKLYFPSSVVQSVKSWMFDEKYIVTESFSSSGTLDIYGESFSYSNASAPIHYGKYSFGLPNVSPDSLRAVGLFVYSSKPFNLSGGGKGSSCYVFYKNTTSQFTDYSYLGIFSSYDEVSSYLVNNFSITSVPSSGLSFGEVPPSADDSLEDNYPVWLDGAITYPPITIGGTEEDDPIVYVPVSVPVYSSATPSLPLTQTEVWTGKDLTSSGTDTDDEEQVIPIAPDLSEPVNSILQLIVQIAADILAIKNAVVSWFTETWATFTSWLMETLMAIKEAVIALPGLIVAAIEAVAATVTSIWEWLKEVLGLTLQQILEALTAIKAWALGLVDALIAALAALLTEIFGVDIAAVQAAVAELRAEFPFFDSIIATGEFLYNGISSGDPPVIYAHLQNAEGSYSWGGTVAVLDMSFYARYKSTGDAIISAALYAFFGWRTFVRLPGIISGAGSDIKEVTNHYDI